MSESPVFMNCSDSSPEVSQFSCLQPVPLLFVYPEIDPVLSFEDFKGENSVIVIDPLHNTFQFDKASNVSLSNVEKKNTETKNSNRKENYSATKLNKINFSPLKSENSRLSNFSDSVCYNHKPSNSPFLKTPIKNYQNIRNNSENSKKTEVSSENRAIQTESLKNFDENFDSKSKKYVYSQIDLYDMPKLSVFKYREISWLVDYKHINYKNIEIFEKLENLADFEQNLESKTEDLAKTKQKDSIFAEIIEKQKNCVEKLENMHKKIGKKRENDKNLEIVYQKSFNESFKLFTSKSRSIPLNKR